MTFIFELHKYRTFGITGSASGISITLFFITLFAGARSMPEIIMGCANEAVKRMFMQAVIEDISTAQLGVVLIDVLISGAHTI